MAQVSFVKACNEFFGKLPGQMLSGFQAELKALDYKDREYFIKEFAKIGVEITPQQSATQS